VIVVLASVWFDMCRFQNRENCASGHQTFVSMTLSQEIAKILLPTSFPDLTLNFLSLVAIRRHVVRIAVESGPACFVVLEANRSIGIWLYLLRGPEHRGSSKAPARLPGRGRPVARVWGSLHSSRGSFSCVQVAPVRSDGRWCPAVRSRSGEHPRAAPMRHTRCVFHRSGR